MGSSALIFKVNKLGDNIVFLPVAQRLAAEGAFDRITIWNTPLALPLYEPLKPRIQLEIVAREPFYAAWRHPAALWKLIRRVRESRSQIALIAEDMGNTAYLLALASTARQRLGVRLPYIKIPLALTQDIPIRHADHAAVKSWELGRALAHAAGVMDWPDVPPPPDLSHLLDDATPYDVLIHAGASTNYQRWPLERYAQMANRLARNLRVGWFHIPSLPAPSLDPGVEVIQSQEFRALTSHIAKATVFVGNNSGPMNVANALGTPCAVLTGPTSRAWDPYWHAGRNLILRDENLPCISCDIPGTPSQKMCRNLSHPMACMEFWTVEKVEQEVRLWHERHAHRLYAK